LNLIDEEEFRKYVEEALKAEKDEADYIGVEVGSEITGLKLVQR